MEAKDTVISPEEIVKILRKVPSDDFLPYPFKGDALKYKTISERQAEISFKAGKKEVGEAICILVGNLMLEDMDKGKLLGEQLRPIFDLCKR